jgi:hypothetical protein
MRNRTELVTNQLGSDFEEEGSDFEPDSGEDWKPEKDEAGVAKKPGSATKKSPTKRKAGKSSGKKSAKRVKKEESESEEEEEEDDEEIEDDNLIEEYIEEDADEAGGSQSNGSKTGSAKKSKSSAPSESSKNFPDKAGIFSLYAYKGDLKNGLRANKNICLWRRDGQSLLQKYLREKEEVDGKIIFNSSMVYSCWEDRRAEEFLEVKVKCCSKDSKDSRVELLDLDRIEQTCIDEKYAELNLEVYVSYADKKKAENQGTAENGEITQTDMSHEIEEEEDYGEEGDDDNEY